MCNYHYLSYALILVLSIWCQWSTAYSRMQSLDEPGFNPNIHCPSKNEVPNWRFCKHGGYIVNPDPETCGDRYVCYVGMNETCDPGDRCEKDGRCTMCGICQKCENADNCSEFQLCSNSMRFPNIFKRTMEKAGLLEYNAKH